MIETCYHECRAFFAPVFILIAIGQGTFTTAVATACALIVGGAFIGSRDLFMKETGES